MEMRGQIISTTRLVNNLLEMARYQSGGFTLNQEWMTVQELAGSALHSLATTGITDKVILKLPQPMALIFLDGALLERVLVNLLENAVKYAGTEAQIILSAEVSAGSLTLHVTDNGPGLPEEMQHRLFEKFSRGTKESAIPGIGLGLAICEAIVGLHHGSITASNLPQGGADFCIRLPQQAPPQLDDLE